MRDTANQWYAMQTKVHKEALVCRQLEQKGIEIFYPKLRVKPVNPRSRKERPYFPGYIFVHVDLEDAISNGLNSTVGAKGLVSFGDVVPIVPDQMIAGLRKHLERVQTTDDDNLDGIKKRDLVDIVKGPLSGYQGLFDMRLPSKDRVQVLLSFLSQYPQRVQLKASAIKKAKKRRRR